MDSSFNALELRDYYSAACPHCQHLDAPWKEAEGLYSGPVKFRKIECSDASWKPVPENAEACKGIHGFPTIRLHDGDRVVEEYHGNRSAEDLKTFAQQHENVATAAMPAALLVAPTLPLSRQTRSRSPASRRAAYAKFL